MAQYSTSSGAAYPTESPSEIEVIESILKQGNLLLVPSENVDQLWSIMRCNKQGGLELVLNYRPIAGIRLWMSDHYPERAK